MLKRLLAVVGLAGAAATTRPGKMVDGPYKNDAANLIYQLLFCDRPQLFKEHAKGELTPPMSILFGDKPNFAEIEKVALNDQQESRMRMVAFNALRAAGKQVPKKVYLGTIIEVGLPEGNDTLAVFVDGRARYINHSGKMVIVESQTNPFDQEIKNLIQASKPVVAAIGPWNKERLMAPTRGMFRMTFLVSDGLYFGQGPMGAMQKDRLAEPVITASTRLLLKIVQNGTAK
jgi:hypothetical protein